MATDGLLPRAFCTVSEETGIPVFSVVFCTLIATVLGNVVRALIWQILNVIVSSLKGLTSCDVFIIDPL